MSVRFAEIPWNAAVTFHYPVAAEEVVQLCWEATGCQQECESKAGTPAFPFHEIQYSTSRYIPKNSGEEMPGGTLEHERASGPCLSQPSLKNKTLLVLLLHPPALGADC